MKGLLQLNRKLRAIPEEAKTRAKAAVLQGAEELQNLQQNLVPYDDGELHDSIVVTKPGEVTPAYSQPGGARRAGPMEAIVTAGNTRVRYAHLVEYGTAPHTIRGRRVGSFGKRRAMGSRGQFGTLVNHPGTKAKPFFWPAYRALKRRIKGRVSRAISKSIREAAARGGK